MIRRTFTSLLLLILVAIVATIGLLHLHREAWKAHGESPLLWDWTDALMEGRIPIAAAQYIATAGAFTLTWVLWSSKWRLLRNLLIAWGITWLPVAFVSTGDVRASSDGPFNFPMAMFAILFFGFVCLVELGLALLFHAFQRSRCKANSIAEHIVNSDKTEPYIHPVKSYTHTGLPK